MASKTRTQVTIQTRQTIVVTPLAESFQAWCEECLDVVCAVRPEFVAGVLNLHPGALSELLAQGKWHAVTTAAATLLICCNSLSSYPAEETVLIEEEGNEIGISNYK